MKKIFAATQHYVVLALRHHHITFPTTKQALLAKAGDELIRIDWDEYVPLARYCQYVKLENYANKAAFFNAIIGTHTTFKF